MTKGGPRFIVQHVEVIICKRTAIVTLSTQNAGQDHITQICAVCLQNLRKKTSASTVVANTTHQEGALTGQTTIERNQGQHIGTSIIR